ncbi:MAG: nicotinate (nicotinamide) nucleotide adenylyltransferase [Pseudomonadota bacterium]|nr:nicotinate (nicotinamide) nucleotide adenylyltransferase [Pseudomonadota bacterium]
MAMPAALRRVGMFGGAFDPPHNAHVALARAAIDTLALDRLHIVPTGDAWHKTRPLSCAAHRLAMCRLAFGDQPRTTVDARELHRSGPTYTIDTLTELQAQYPGAALHLIIGADQAAAFHTWRQAADIVAIATISIAVRAHQSSANGLFDPENPLPGLAGAPARIRLLSLPPMPHSATDVRRRVAAGQPVGDLVPPAVAGYIADHHLYRTAQ